MGGSYNNVAIAICFAVSVGTEHPPLLGKGGGGGIITCIVVFTVMVGCISAPPPLPLADLSVAWLAIWAWSVLPWLTAQFSLMLAFTKAMFTRHHFEIRSLQNGSIQLGLPNWGLQRLWCTQFNPYSRRLSHQQVCTQSQWFLNLLPKQTWDVLPNQIWAAEQAAQAWFGRRFTNHWLPTSLLVLLTNWVRKLTRG